jgi:hypothetical protein
MVRMEQQNSLEESVKHTVEGRPSEGYDNDNVEEKVRADLTEVPVPVPI